MIKRFFWVGWAIVGLLSACTSGPELSKFPRAAIDRPYTLPKGVASWETIVPFSVETTRVRTEVGFPIPIPLGWRSSLSDDWMLYWSPLPFSLGHQFLYTKDQVVGSTFGSGFGYDSDHGFTFFPGVDLYHRIRVAPKIAIETILAVDAAYMTKGAPWTWEVAVSSGPMFQLTDTFSITPKIQLDLDRSYKRFYIGDSVDYTASSSAQLTLPIGFTALWSFARQWDLSGSYWFSKIGHEEGYSRHAGTVRLTLFW